MDFEAIAIELVNDSGIPKRARPSAIEMASKVLQIGFKQGRDSMKKECIEVVEDWIFFDDGYRDDAIKEIKKL